MTKSRPAQPVERLNWYAMWKLSCGQIEKQFPERENKQHNFMRRWRLTPQQQMTKLRKNIAWKCFYVNVYNYIFFDNDNIWGCGSIFACQWAIKSLFHFAQLCDTLDRWHDQLRCRQASKLIMNTNNIERETRTKNYPPDPISDKVGK